MRFLVTRMDALNQPAATNRAGHQIRTSELWPTVVEAHDHEDAVRVVYAQHLGLSLDREFLVAALIDAEVVAFKRKPADYCVVRRPF